MEDMDNSGPVDLGNEPPAVTKPKKPRKKAVKKKAKTKKVAKKIAKPKAKKAAKKKKTKAQERPERLDLRLTKSEKIKLAAKAKATRRTVTSIVAELIEKMK